MSNLTPELQSLCESIVLRWSKTGASEEFEEHLKEALRIRFRVDVETAIRAHVDVVVGAAIERHLDDFTKRIDQAVVTAFEQHMASGKIGEQILNECRYAITNRIRRKAGEAYRAIEADDSIFTAVNEMLSRIQIDMVNQR